MSISELGALGEFIGSIGVLITLIYLAIQINHSRKGLEANTIALKGASEMNGNESTINQLISLYSDDLMIEVVIRASGGLSDLSVKERIKFNLLNHTNFQLHQATFFQWKRRLLDDEYWSFCIRFFGGLLLSQVGVQQWWAQNRETYSPDYRVLIDRLIASQDWNDASKYIDDTL